MVVAIGVEFVAQVGVFTAQEWGVDGTTTEWHRRSVVEVCWRRRHIFEIAVAACDDDVEGLAVGVFGEAVLPDVSGPFGRHERILPQRAADGGEGGWVGASDPSVDCGVAFEEDVEACAAVRVRVTSLLAEVGVVGLEKEEAEIGAGTAGTGLALEGEGIAFRGRRLARLVGECLESIEAPDGIRCGFRTVAICSKISPAILEYRTVWTYSAEERRSRMCAFFLLTRSGLTQQRL